MDRRRELEPHRLFVYEPEKILRNKLVFKAIIDKIIGADSAFEKGAHLFDKAAFEPLIQPLVNKRIPLLTTDKGPDNECLFGLIGGAGDRALRKLYL